MINIIPELGVNSVKSSVEFYINLFKGKLVDSVSDENKNMIWAEINVFGSPIMFEEVKLLSEEFDNLDIKRLKDGSVCNFFRLEDIDLFESLYQQAKDMKVEFASNLKTTDYGTKEFAVYDLDKNIIIVACKL